ncbi:MAG: hypothetical protein AAFQ58_12385 [Pseudomonadota bacterium]
MNGKFFVSPPEDSADFKQLFAQIAALGAGRPMEHDGFPPGPWTPDLMVEAITQVDPRGEGIDLRTVQLWFQDNDKGISAANIQLLARVLGCGDKKLTSAWQLQLTRSQRRLAARRKRSRSRRHDARTLPSKPYQARPECAPKRGFNLARFSKAVFSSRSYFNLTATVWAGCVVLGFLSYIFGVHSVTYQPFPGLHKQVGFLWAPNWTVLELVILPLFLMGVAELLRFWTHDRRSVLGTMEPQKIGIVSFDQRLESSAWSHWAALFVCVFVVFLVQWIGVHLSAFLTGDPGNLMMDWTLLALVRPEVISVPKAIVISMLAFIYTALICYLFLIGLLLINSISHDVYMVAVGSEQTIRSTQSNDFARVCAAVMSTVFQCAILGVWIASCIKLQAAYLLSTGENVLSWLLHDAKTALGAEQKPIGQLHQRALAYFTSFLLLFSTVSVFCLSALNIRRSVETYEPPYACPTPISRSDIPWRRMSVVIALLTVNFLLIGIVPGFSILLVVSLCASLYCLLNPRFRSLRARSEKPGVV